MYSVSYKNIFNNNYKIGDENVSKEHKHSGIIFD